MVGRRCLSVRSNQKVETPVSTLPLSGIGLGMDDVVGGDPVRGDDQQLVAEVVDLTDLAGGEQGEVGKSGHAADPSAAL